MIDKSLVVPKGYFAFSKPQYSKRQLALWELHFAELSIPTILIQDAKGDYILCRAGKEALGEILTKRSNAERRADLEEIINLRGGLGSECVSNN